jgi:hypothetical protein
MSLYYLNSSPMQPLNAWKAKSWLSSIDDVAGGSMSVSNGYDRENMGVGRVSECEI